MRITRISKLYKLIKISKLIKILKALKNKKDIAKKIMSTVKQGGALDRFFFFIFLVFLVCHFIGCLWIFFGESFHDEEMGSWIIANNYENMNMWELYATSAYFTM